MVNTRMLKNLARILAAVILSPELRALQERVAERDRLVLDLRRRLDAARSERDGSTDVQLAVTLGGELYELDCECDSPSEAEALRAGWVLSGYCNGGRVS